MKKRSIGLMILFTIITFGIYAVIWQCMFQAELKKSTGEGFGGVGHFFMCLITFGIYEIYWQYACGKRLGKLGVEDQSLVYLILTLIGFSIISMILQQLEANKVASV